MSSCVSVDQMPLSMALNVCCSNQSPTFRAYKKMVVFSRCHSSPCPRITQQIRFVAHPLHPLRNSLCTLGTDARSPRERRSWTPRNGGRSVLFQSDSCFPRKSRLHWNSHPCSEPTIQTFPIPAPVETFGVLLAVELLGQKLRRTAHPASP